MLKIFYEYHDVQIRACLGHNIAPNEGNNVPPAGNKKRVALSSLKVPLYLYYLVFPIRKHYQQINLNQPT